MVALVYGGFGLVRSNGLWTAWVRDDKGNNLFPARVVPADMVGMTGIGDHIVPLAGSHTSDVCNLIDEVSDGELAVMDDDTPPVPPAFALSLVAA
jgi:hypothetical protein